MNVLSVTPVTHSQVELTVQQKRFQIIGLILTMVYAAAIVWLYATEPRSFEEMATGAQVAAGTYQVDQEKMLLSRSFDASNFQRLGRWQRAEQQRRIQRRSFTSIKHLREGWGEVRTIRICSEGMNHQPRIRLSPIATIPDGNSRLHTPPS